VHHNSHTPSIILYLYCQISIVSTIYTMALSSQSIEEIRLVANQRNTSPRGVADDGNFFDSSSNDNDQSSNVKSEKGTAPSQADIDTYTSEFIEEIMMIALTITEYRRAMTIVPSDVAEALDVFARQQSTYNVDLSEKFTQWTADCDDMDEDNDNEAMDVDIKVQDVEKVRTSIIKLQAMFRGKQVRDQILNYDSGSDDEYEDEAKNKARVNQMNLQNTSSPTFYSVNPLVENIRLRDEEFKTETFMPIFNNEVTSSTINICNIPIGDGINSADDEFEGGEMVVMGMMKKATYAFLVSKLS